MKKLLLLLSLCITPLWSCRQPPPTPASGLATTPMTIGSKTYTLEIAAKSLDRSKGLMYRDSMPADHGMIFIFTRATDQSFWMHNCRIPLDILYLDAAGKVVSIHRMEPYVETGTRSKGPAQYAVELNAGEASASGVKEGDTLQIPAPALNAPADP